ncbi:hypothetical protein ACHAW5_002993 [Stephanodiscus triporus]|uniref:CP12 domain-containing protein n=1 Tax=Stephanodiscus triporus TaxID=2934178 RepID=A0ABD3NCM7_9STRA
MKLLIVAALISSSVAFAPAPIARARSVVPLSESATASAIEAALEASKTHGPTSKEAQLLWEVVEEMNASDNSAAYKPAVVDEEYEAKVRSLAQMLTKTKAELDMVRQLAEDLKGVKLATPESRTAVPVYPASMKKALAEARSATEKFGVESTEAKLAWETVEEIAASSTDDEATRAPLDEECLVDLIEGCEALEKFKSALDSR